VTPPAAEFDVAMMRRAIALAMRGRGTVEPNPSVGCVIVKEGRVIGEGHTQPYGGAHAEPTALASCTESPVGATAYTTLEPCCHTNKKTPPCVPVVIGAGIRRVVVGCLDPNPEVNGEGLGMLREAGVEVEGPVLEGECKQVIAPFFARVNLKRPYVTLKWAETVDGKVAGPGGRRMQISGAESSRQVHELRGRSDAIVVGINTVLNDDPLLTARGATVNRHPVRVVLNPDGKSTLYTRFAHSVTQEDQIFMCVSEHADLERPDPYPFQYVRLPLNPSGMLSLSHLLARLAECGVTHAMVEAGPTLAAGFFKAGLADRVWVFRSRVVAVGDDTAPEATKVPASFIETGRVALGSDGLTEYVNGEGRAFFAAAESADFVRVRGPVQNGRD
jgi:diaminohydroxyphosphoribosylaminopyrimidine deaminase/5-amino-6-(5-phosphoribosylamino)uracil reductase